jgi:hypothetical protein
LSAMPDTDYSIQPGPPAEPDAPPAPWIVPIDQLTAHPGNVREDLDLTPEFCASIAELGIPDLAADHVSRDRIPGY